MNYSDLKTNISTWLIRDDLTAVVDTFIDMAEADMNRKIRHWQMDERTSLSVSSQFTALPSDFLAIVSVSLADTTPRFMEGLSKAEMQVLREEGGDTAGRPQYYALSGGQIEVYPTPDDTYTVTLEYQTRLDALSDSNTTNWVSTHHPDAYLYGSLLQAAPFLQDDARIGVWQGLYANAINAINEEAWRAAGGSSPRMKIRGLS